MMERDQIQKHFDEDFTLLKQQLLILKEVSHKAAFLAERIETTILGLELKEKKEFG